MTHEKKHASLSVIAASYLGPSLSPNEDPPWDEASLPHPCDDLVQKVLGQPMRRAGRFIKMVCAGAMSCLREAPPAALKNKRAGIFLATGLGNGDEILPFVTQVFKHAGGFPSPNQFANSVSNAAAFFLARASDIRGVILTVSDEELSFEAALWLAQSYLESGEIDLALVGGCDVYTPTVEEYRERMNTSPANCRDLPIGEGSSWVLLGVDQPERIGEILTVQMHSAAISPAEYLRSEGHSLLSSAAADSPRRVWLPGFRLQNPDAPEGFDLQDYLQSCGIHPTASAFGMARALRSNPASLLIHYNHLASGRTAVIVAKT